MQFFLRVMAVRTVIACGALILAAHATVAGAQTSAASVGAAFQITRDWVSTGAAFDGTNYLVALESGSHKANVAAQLISQTGANVGPLITLGAAGGTCCSAVAYDGANYLMVWEDDTVGQNIGTTTGFSGRGQFISRAGAVLGQPFTLTGTDVWFDGVKFLAYGGGKYLLTYLKLTATGNYVAGRLIGPDGSVGSELRISSGSGKGGSIAYDGTNFFVVWAQGSDVRGRFVNPTGTLGQEISVNASPAASDNPVHATFDGTNYLVVFHDAVGSNAWDAYAQLVSSAGALVGGVITISNDPGTQLAFGAAFDGTNYLVAWTDLQAATNWVYGRFISKSGAAVGDRVTISSNAGSQFGGIVGYANGKYLANINAGVQIGSGGVTLFNAVAYGALVGTYQAPIDPAQPVAQPTAQQTAYVLTDGQLPSAAVEVVATGTLGRATLSMTLDLARVLQPVTGTLAARGEFAAGYSIYVVALAPAGVLGLSTATLFQLPASSVWGPLSSPMGAYREGLSQSAVDRVQISLLKEIDVTSLVGTEIYVGYGTSDAEMIERKRYRGVYVVR